MSVTDSESERGSVVEVANVSNENETIDEDQGEIEESENNNFMVERQTDEDYSKYSERIFDFSPKAKEQTPKLLIEEINDNLNDAKQSHADDEIITEDVNQQSLLEKCEYLEKAEEEHCKIIIEENKDVRNKEIKLLVEELDAEEHVVVNIENNTEPEGNEDTEVRHEITEDTVERLENIKHKPCDELIAGNIPGNQVQELLIEEIINEDVILDEIVEHGKIKLKSSSQLKVVIEELDIEEMTEAHTVKAKNFSEEVSYAENLQLFTDTAIENYIEKPRDNQEGKGTIITEKHEVLITEKNIDLEENKIEINYDSSHVDNLDKHYIEQEKIVSEQVLTVQVSANLKESNEHVTNKQIYQALEEDIKKLCVVQTAIDSSDESDSSSSDSEGEKPFYRKMDKGEITEYNKTTPEEDVGELKELLGWNINKYNYKIDVIPPFKKAPKETAEDEMYALLTNKKQKPEYELTEPADVSSDTDVIMYARKNYTRYVRDEDLPSISEPQIHRALKISRNITVKTGNNEDKTAEEDFEESSSECNSIIASNSLSEARQSIREFSRNLAEFTNRYKAQYAALIQNYNDTCDEYTRKVNEQCEKEYQESLCNLRRYVGENSGEKRVDNREGRAGVLESIACVSESYNKSYEKSGESLIGKENKEFSGIIDDKEDEMNKVEINEEIKDDETVTTGTVELQSKEKNEETLVDNENKDFVEIVDGKDVTNKEISNEKVEDMKNVITCPLEIESKEDETKEKIHEEVKDEKTVNVCTLEMQSKEGENNKGMENEKIEDEKTVTTCTLEMQLAQDD